MLHALGVQEVSLHPALFNLLNGLRPLVMGLSAPWTSYASPWTSGCVAVQELDENCHNWDIDRITRFLEYGSLSSLADT